VEDGLVVALALIFPSDWHDKHFESSEAGVLERVSVLAEWMGGVTSEHQGESLDALLSGDIIGTRYHLGFDQLQ
jgi:hypothetical protein